MLGGRYRLGPTLGSGGMAQVFDAMDERLERPVAVKLLRAELSGDAALRRRFEVEARSAARLVHPNVVGVFDTGETGLRPYIVMERLPGDTLADRLGQGPMDERGTRRLASEVLGALAAAHAAGIVHRDVKPSNILWAADGSVKVADFGIAKGMEPVLDPETGDLTGTNLVIGTPAYLAPERMAGEAATPRSDLWSLGVVLYEALAGERPFPRRAMVAGDPGSAQLVPLTVRRPDVDPALAAAIDRSLAWRPEERFASAADMAAAARLELAGGAAIAAAASGTDLATARLENDAAGPTAIMGGPPEAAGDQPRTAVLGGGEPAPPPPARAEGDERARRLGAVAILGILLLVLAGIAIAAVVSTNGGSTPPSTTAPPTTAAPPTTHAPETTTPTTTPTTHATTTQPPSTTTSSTTTTTTAPGPPSSPVLRNQGQDRGILRGRGQGGAGGD